MATYYTQLPLWKYGVEVLNAQQTGQPPMDQHTHYR
jgi:hypothetical protein